ncbi:hypothetical protein F3Y22_tig00113096pilonHSYRG00137 [Hibiscus syriacus]|uniref:Uncharacterized protein n=1 Tax=Hibiscus syriacus TaxID=106335 RepID=A0A6A2XMD0_HIBSY|nr:hypothetical protein F3Y22_tig00113096pilonHSYRG00137 [Hibiscus syriacus]
MNCEQQGGISTDEEGDLQDDYTEATIPGPIENNIHQAIEVLDDFAGNGSLLIQESYGSGKKKEKLKLPNPKNDMHSRQSPRLKYWMMGTDGQSIWEEDGEEQPKSKFFIDFFVSDKQELLQILEFFSITNTLTAKSCIRPISTCIDDHINCIPESCIMIRKSKSFPRMDRLHSTFAAGTFLDTDWQIHTMANDFEFLFPILELAVPVASNKRVPDCRCSFPPRL